MGQYYKIIFLSNENIILAFYDIEIPWGLKLLEHAYIKNPLLTKIEFLLSPYGKFYKSKMVWAGDYAENEKNTKNNLYSLAEHCNYTEAEQKELHEQINNNLQNYILQKKDFKYIVNHSKKEYVNMHVISDGEFHPLPLLVAEGNGKGGGDYYGKNSEFVGIWARDIISIEKNFPFEFKELFDQTLFMEFH
jgi:hypothetical protein